MDSRIAWALRRLPLLLAVVVLALGMAACGGDDDDDSGGSGEGTAASSEAPAETTTVKLATNPFAGSAAPFIARDAGLLEEENLDMEVEFLRFAPDAVAAVVGGSADFAILSTVGLMAAVNENVPIEVVGPGYFVNPPEQGYYVKEDSDIQTVADIEGKKIGTAGRGNINELALLALADQEGVPPDSYEWVELPLPDMAQAIRSGRVDVGPLTEPFITQSTDGLRELVDNAYAAYGSEDQILTYHITSKQFAEENPEVVAAFKRALMGAMDHANENPDSIREAVGSYTEVDEATLDAMALPAFSTDMARDSLEEQAQTALEYEYIEELPDFDKVFPAE
jgi:NitT/TauT family transport system substrate-binding protein